MLCPACNTSKRTKRSILTIVFQAGDNRQAMATCQLKLSVEYPTRKLNGQDHYAYDHGSTKNKRPSVIEENQEIVVPSAGSGINCRSKRSRGQSVRKRHGNGSDTGKNRTCHDQTLFNHFDFA